MNAQLEVLQPFDAEEKTIFNEPNETVTLAGKKYGLKPLTMKRSREWRTKIVESMKSFGKATSAEGVLELELTNEVVTSMAKIVIEYIGDPSLVLDVLDETATEQEVVDALFIIAKHARIPFAKLGQV